MSKQPRDHGASTDVFLRVRGRIAEALSGQGVEIREGVGAMEMAIGTFSPSSILKRFLVSDFPFIGARYVSLRDGGVYIVAGATDDASDLLAYRLGFIRSIFTHRGGQAVAISEDGWMGANMVLFSLLHAGFETNSGRELVAVHDEAQTRRSYPIKKLKAYVEYWKRRIGGRA